MPSEEDLQAKYEKAQAANAKSGTKASHEKQQEAAQAFAEARTARKQDEANDPSHPRQAGAPQIGA